MWWPFKRRKQPLQQLDVTGPATIYGHHAGAAGLPPADRPSWDGPTVIPTTSPLITPGQIRRAGGDE